MRVLFLGSSMELLAAVHSVAVDDQPQPLEGVERPVDRRRGDVWVDGSASLDEFRARDMAGCGAQDIEDRASLRSPPKASRVELLADCARFEG